MNWYVGTDWAVIPAGGNSLRQVFVRLEDYEALTAENTEHWAWREKMGTEAQQAEARIRELEAALRAVVMEGKAYAAHHTLEHCAQAMYDIASGALTSAETVAEPTHHDWTAGRLCRVLNCMNKCAPYSVTCAEHSTTATSQL
jgi:hypothetical protein